MYQATHSDSNPLISATLETIAQKGLPGLSSREIAAGAGVSAAAINRRYGSQRQLIDAAFEQACLEYRHHAHAVREILSGLRAGAADSGLLLFSLMTEIWTEAEDLSLIGWNLSTLPPDRKEDRQHRSAWQESTALLSGGVGAALEGSDEIGELCTTILGSLTRGAFITAHPVIFRAWSFELCQRLGERLFHQQPPEIGDGSWRQRLPVSTPLIPPLTETTPHPSKLAIIRAAADMIEDAGPFALTHRLIAERAGISLSSTTHHFSSLGDILWEAVLELIQRSEGPQIAKRSLDIETLSDELAAYTARPGMSLTRRLSEVELAARYRPELRQLADTLLLRHGASSTAMLLSLTDRTVEIDRVDGVLWHHTVMGLLEATEHLPAARRQKHVRQRISAWARHLFAPQTITG